MQPLHGLQGEWFIHYTTAAPVCDWENNLYEGIWPDWGSNSEPES